MKVYRKENVKFDIKNCLSAFIHCYNEYYIYIFLGLELIFTSDYLKNKLFKQKVLKIFVLHNFAQTDALSYNADSATVLSLTPGYLLLV
jgi:hypothetical protein